MTREVRPFDGDGFPRFLNRNDPGPRPVVAPPPLSFLDRTVLQTVRHAYAVAAPYIAPASVALCFLVLAAASLFRDGTPEAGKPVLKKPPEIVTANNREFVDAFALVAAFEARVGYASRLSERLAEWKSAETQAAANASAEVAASGDAPSAEWEMSSAVGLLILRNLPSGATFLAGAPAGDGAWAMPSGDPDQLVMTLGEGFDDPVMADVEMISRSGLSLGTLRLQLLKPGLEKIAAAPDEPLPREAQPAEAEAPKVVKKVKRRHRRQSGKQTVAGAGRAEPAQKPIANSTYRPSGGANEVAERAPADGAQQGILSKFVTWLKSGQKSSEQDESPVSLGFGQ